jgi:8-oxo-dGTP pyrophosphatase MutT (NUDIX family)
MTSGADILHYTAGAIVLNDDAVLLVQHRNHGRWLQPGGEIEPHEDPAQAAVREVKEETGIDVELMNGLNFAHPSARSVPPPFAIFDRVSRDRRIGPHRCLSFLYVCRPIAGTLTPQLTEVAAVRWVPLAEIAQLSPIPDDLPDLVAAAARWAAGRG